MASTRTTCTLAACGFVTLGAALLGLGHAAEIATNSAYSARTRQVAQPARDEVHIIVPHRPIWREQSVEVRGVDVQVDIVEQVATVHMAVTLFNPARRAQEAQLVLPVPTDAAIRSFGIDAISEEPNAIIMPRDEASRLYREIVSKMVDPGLLEFVGTGLIQSSVFPVPAGGTQTFRVVYEHALKGEGGRMDYLLTRSDSIDAARVPWTIGLTVRAAAGVGTIYSPTHDVQEKRTAAGIAELKVLNPQEPGSVRLSIGLGRSAGASATVLAYPDPRVADGAGGYFMLIVDAPEATPTTDIKREVTIVIDRSGSMQGQKIEQARAAVLQVIEALDEGEMFNIIDYSDTISRFSPQPVARSAQSIASMRAYVSSIKAMGGTNLHDALLESLTPTPAPGTLPIVLFLTDGLPTVGQTDELAIRTAAEKANTHQRRIFSFGVGHDVNAPLLSGVALGSRGVVTFVSPTEDVEVKVGQMFAKLTGPVLTHPVLREMKIDAAVRPPAIRDTLPAELPDVFRGEQLLILGKYTTSDPIHLALSGQQGEEMLNITAMLAAEQASRTNAFIPRLWAQRRIGTLIDLLRQKSADPDFGPSSPAYKEIVDEIVALSKEHGILTEYTAFIALEDEYRKDVASKGAGRDRYFAPATESRSGGGGVQREATKEQYRLSLRVAPSQTADEFVDAQLAEVSGGRGAGAVVKNFSGLTVYKRGTRWVEASLLDTADMKPDETVDFNSDRYIDVLDVLSREGRHGVLSLEGEVLLRFEGKILLIRSVGR